MRVYWLEQSEADVPIVDDWLSEGEAARLNNFRVPKRRADWRLGRWTAKRAVGALLNAAGDTLALKDIQVQAAASGEPVVTLSDGTSAVTISISHCAGTAVCAVALDTLALGCDLEAIEPRSDAFLADYFTPLEQELVAQTSAADHHLLTTLLWSAKESALKALHVGLRADTRSVEVSLGKSWPGPAYDLSPHTPCVFSFDSTQYVRDWFPLFVTHANGNCSSGWWFVSDKLVRTIVTAQPSNVPSVLSGNAGANP